MRDRVRSKEHARLEATMGGPGPKVLGDASSPWPCIGSARIPPSHPPHPVCSLLFTGLTGLTGDDVTLDWARWGQRHGPMPLGPVVVAVKSRAVVVAVKSRAVVVAVKSRSCCS